MHRFCLKQLRLQVNLLRLPRIRRSACPAGKSSQWRAGALTYKSIDALLALYQCFLTLPSVRVGKALVSSAPTFSSRNLVLPLQFHSSCYLRLSFASISALQLESTACSSGPSSLAAGRAYLVPS